MKINNQRFSIRFCTVAKTYGFKTLGRFERFLRQLESPNVKLYFSTTYVRAVKLLKEIEEFKTETK